MLSEILEVKLVPVKKNPDDKELADKIYYECMFCGKKVGLYPYQRGLCEKLSGPDFYCSFCLRNNFHTKNKHNILILSFRAVIGYYYTTFYVNARKMYYSEIEDYINCHVKVGLENPVFSYDPETMLWFVDFSKIGKGNKKITINDVLKTIVNILACFNLNDNLGNNKSSVFFEKYKESIEKFYASRWRPEGKKALIPTLQGCEGVLTKPSGFEENRRFMLNKMIAVF